MAHTVLEDVTDDTELIEVTTATLGTKWFLEGNLDAADRLLIPERAERDVGEPKHEQVLDHLLAKVVINPERLLFRPVLLEGPEENTRGLKILSEWLLDNNTAFAIVGSHVALLLEMLSDWDEDTGGKGEVEEPVALLILVTRLDLLKGFIEILEGRAIFIASRNIRRQLLELL